MNLVMKTTKLCHKHSRRLHLYDILYINVLFFFTCSVNLGTLLTSGEGGSSLLLFHPVFFTESYVTYDRELRRACCGLAGMCGQFYTRRPPNDCSLYRPPFFSKTLRLLVCLLKQWNPLVIQCLVVISY